MTRVRKKGELVRKFVIEHVDQHPKSIAAVTAEKFGISRQAVNKHLTNLVAEKAIVSAGKTNARVYKLAPLVEWYRVYQMGPSLTEGAIWNEFAPSLGALPENCMRIWQHGFTEMFNNAIDHSGGGKIVVKMAKTAASTEAMIVDDGVGIFRKIQTALNLLDPRHAVLELAKGKFTTDPANHSGEGIFFTSRAFDAFAILSGSVHFSHDLDDEEDWIQEGKDAFPGTAVFMRNHNHTARTMKRIFDEFTTNEDDNAFTKTVVPVRLAQYGDDNLVSRSQAKRLLTRIDRFRTVLFDFSGVDSVGQAFSDEIFRVFQNQHPEMTLMPIHANIQVKAMIERVRAGAESQPPIDPQLSLPGAHLGVAPPKTSGN